MDVGRGKKEGLRIHFRVRPRETILLSLALCIAPAPRRDVVSATASLFLQKNHVTAAGYS